MVVKICHLLQMMKKFMKSINEIWEVVRKLFKLKFTVDPARVDKY